MYVCMYVCIQRANDVTRDRPLHVMTSWPPSWKYDVMSEILTPSIDAYALEKKSCQMSSRSDLKPRSLRLFWKRSPQQEEAIAQNKMISARFKNNKYDCFIQIIRNYNQPTSCWDNTFRFFGNLCCMAYWHTLIATDRCMLGMLNCWAWLL